MEMRKMWLASVCICLVTGSEMSFSCYSRCWWWAGLRDWIQSETWPRSLCLQHLHRFPQRLGWSGSSEPSVGVNMRLNVFAYTADMCVRGHGKPPAWTWTGCTEPLTLDHVSAAFTRRRLPKTPPSLRHSSIPRCIISSHLSPFACSHAESSQWGPHIFFIPCSIHLLL